MDEKNERLSLLKELVKLANSDKNLKKAEYDFLSAIAIQLEITPEDFVKVFDENISFQPPKLEGDRIVQFQRLILLMNVDQSVDDEQLKIVRELGIRMGLNPAATNKVLERMHDFDNGIIPPSELMSIFQAYHN
jgi:hypothetical protein